MPVPLPASVSRFAVALAARAAAGGRILLTGPMDPDGDSIGACLALQRGLRGLGAAEVAVAGDPGRRYAFAPGAGTMLPDHALGGPWDLVVVLDGDRNRLEPGAEAAFQGAAARGLIDHHRSTTTQGYDLALVLPEAASTCELVFGLFQAWGLPLDPELATLLYIGLVFDTGGFRHSNTTADTHRLAATLLEQGIDHTAISLRVLAERDPPGFRLLGEVVTATRFFAGGLVAVGEISQALLARLGARTEDIEGIVDTLLVTRGVEVACLLIEKPDGRVKLSLRSRSRVDVAALAGRLFPGGGGHARAAGVLMPGPLADAWQAVPSALVAAALAP